MADREQGGGFQNPSAPGQAPGFPENFNLTVFDGFEGLNTKPTRQAIGDQECFILDNWMPLGKNNLRTMFDVGDPIFLAPAFTQTSGASISYFTFATISDQAYLLVFLSNGSIGTLPLPALANTSATTVAPSLTISDPTQQLGVSQWGSQYIIISAPQSSGYFLYDGGVFYQPGSLGPQVTINNGGLDYTSPPSIQAIGGGGTGAAFLSTVNSSGSVTTITISSQGGQAGTGYKATDAVYLAFSGGGSKTTATAKAVLSSQTVLSITMLTAGTGYSPISIRATVAGGGGFGATLGSIAVNAAGGVSSITVLTSGAGYTSLPTVIFTDVGNPVAQATVVPMPFGVQGTSVETFTQRVWVANGAAPSNIPPKSLVQFTAPNNPVDFGAPDGGGQFLSTDSFLRVGFHGLRQSNGFLYLVGDSSINFVSGVSTSGTPPTTMFTNQNIDPQIGCPWPNTIQVFSRGLVFANTFGVHALFGGAVQKESNNLDGIYTSVTPVDTPHAGVSPLYSNGFAPSAGVCLIFGIHVYVLLLPIIDQVTGQTVHKLLCWDGKRWWTSSQSIEFKQVASQEINSVLTLFGTDGKAVYPCFQRASTKITKTVQSKLWDTPSYIVKKHAIRVYGLFESSATIPDQMVLSVDTETGSTFVTSASLFNTTWTNQFAGPVLWTNNAGLPVQWISSGQTNFVSAIDAAGVLLGLTLTTSDADYVLNSLSIVWQQYTVNV